MTEQLSGEFRFLRAGAALLAVLALLLLAWWQWPAPAIEGPARDEVSEQPDASAVRRFAGPQEALVAPLPAAGSVPMPAWGEHSLPNDSILIFADPAAMAAFAQRAVAAGLTIAGQMNALNALRVTGPAALVASLLPEGAEWAANYLVNVPRPMEREDFDRSQFSEFGANVLRFLGLPAGADNSTWGRGVKIAILDTGIQPHSGLGQRDFREVDLIGGAASGDFLGHGTAVAGFIASLDDLAPGLAPGSDLLSFRVLDADGRGDVFTLADGIIRAVDAGAAIINMSLGSYADSALLRRAVEYAQSRGVLLVAATGNDGLSTPTFPAAYPGVLGVAAVDARAARVPFSNSGEGVDLAAPGFGLHALWDDDAIVYFDGTSASTPLVAAAAARLLESGLARSADQAREILLQNANEAGFPGKDPQFGAGILNIGRLESIGQSGIFDVALADFYPDTANLRDQTFPLYISFENRGTEFLPSSTVMLTVNGVPFRYQFGGMQPGAVESIQVPMTKAALSTGQPVRVTAEVKLPANLEDKRPANNAGEIILTLPPSD